jgi:hypothetical protein
MPFYARLGFEEIPPEELSTALLAVTKHETHRGLDPARRVPTRWTVKNNCLDVSEQCVTVEDAVVKLL